MLAYDTRQSVARLAQAVLSLRPLGTAVAEPLYVAPFVDGTIIGWRSQQPGSDYVSVPDLLNRVAARLHVPRFEVCTEAQASKLGTFGRVMSDKLNLAAFGKPEFAVPASALAEVDQIVDEVVAQSFEGFCVSAEVASFDGSQLRAYAAGMQHNQAVVVASACGMPAQLCERWIRFLAQDYLVITWESRGLFGDQQDFDRLAYDVTAQANDLFAVMDHFGVSDAHLMGLCGGAVIAIAAASARPAQASTLSLWHGDFELGPDCPKTNHQHNLKALMAMAAESRTSAASIHTVLCQSMLRSVPPDLAHLVLYPYATPELMFRYCRLNGSIMDTNVTQWLDKVVQPALVVTSQDDDTAHPAGSRTVAERLANATLHVAPHGDHISLFNAESSLLNLAASFLEQQYAASRSAGAAQS